MTKVAVALFVKNEYSDIAGWIAWYQALGVDKLFIFDDYSTDGTFEIIQAAAQIYNIQYFRTDPVQQPNFYWRQRDSFMSAVEIAKEEYDWIGFLDADEYVYLNSFDNLADFLDQFPDADGIAINWCIYGNSNKIIRPRGVTVEVFLEHSDIFFGDNQQVKSFIRPEKLGSHYLNPHQYDIDLSRYVDVKGNVIEWRGCNKDVEWEGAKVMHYICRSMEQYIGRIKKRTDDLGDSIKHWQQFGFHFDTIFVDKEPLRMMPRVRQHLSKINQQIIGNIRKQIKEKSFLEALSFYPSTYEHSLKPKQDNLYQTFKEMSDLRENASVIVRLIGKAEQNLYVSVLEQKLLQTTEQEAQIKSLIPVYGLVFPYLPDVIILTALLEQKYYPISFIIEGQYLLSSEHYLHASFNEEQEEYSLTSIYNSSKLGFSQQNTKNIQLYDMADIHSACFAWEVQVTQQKLKEEDMKIPLLHPYTSLQELYSTLNELPKKSDREFLRIIANLNSSEKAKFKSLFPGLIDQFL
ncbi:glycosyltransferase family 2 protein [Commensalibacter nepenthis]|uniref:Glycosyltransferase family 2 protein n=1 Tax=Commensalibacter nepenthis TaxID=3043872 RepID=A0ABT6QB56_9PROT|nr:glycosyltransferase family 2 protein [Commensalibacter sp. TBRC 10068]MDI2113493.1 glycosyltransferase family 2 protein [Commensalibacter sp. TBRC 10068]